MPLITAEIYVVQANDHGVLQVIKIRWEYCDIPSNILPGKTKYSKNEPSKNNASTLILAIYIYIYLFIYSVCLFVLSNGGYGNQTNATQPAGQGIEEWIRYCDAPVPRYGGKILLY